MNLMLVDFYRKVYRESSDSWNRSPAFTVNGEMRDSLCEKVPVSLSVEGEIYAWYPSGFVEVLY